MGHERVGALPHSQKWREVVSALSVAGMTDQEVGAIAERTLQNVRKRYRRIAFDRGVIAAFEFLIILATASRSSSPNAELRAAGVELSGDPTPFVVARAAHSWVNKRSESLEYAELAKFATADALAAWYEKNQVRQSRLFELSDEPFEVWRKTGRGDGFCELSRLFFSRFTSRYLNYFLEREASAVIDERARRQAFQEQLERNINEISQHAFETSRITQSYAAGWFNKYAASGPPPKKVVQGFLQYAFGKMREEMLRNGSV